MGNRYNSQRNADILNEKGTSQPNIGPINISRK